MSQLNDRPFPTVHQASERDMLETLLDWYRDGIVAKVDGLSDEYAAVVAATGSETSIAGLVKHLALVEDAWFCRFVGQQFSEPWNSIDFEVDPNWEFRTARTEPLSVNVARYRESVERSRTIAQRYQFDDVASPDNLEGRPPFTLRYVTVHLLEETARHLGHLDILREQADGGQGE
jgi:uncharacterized damage-inducible protein DinB